MVIVNQGNTHCQLLTFMYSKVNIYTPRDVCQSGDRCGTKLEMKKFQAFLRIWEIEGVGRMF